MEIHNINKPGRPIGTTKPDAICCNPEAIKIQRKQANLKHKLTPGYIRTKIISICRRNNLPQLDLRDKSFDELKLILDKIKASKIKK